MLKIIKYPSPVLRFANELVTVFDDELKELVDEMTIIMTNSRGVGLAAPQVGINKKIAIVNTDGKRYVLINPRIISAKGEQFGQEGCLSFPGIFENIKRAETVTVECYDETGEKQFYEVSGLTARAFQHEIDHLDGKLLIDNLSTIKRDIINRKIRKNSRGH